MAESLTILEFNARGALSAERNAEEARGFATIEAEWARDAETTSQRVAWYFASIFKPDVAAIPCAFPQGDSLDPAFARVLTDKQYVYAEAQNRGGSGLVLAVKAEKLVRFSDPIDLLGGIAVQATLTNGRSVIALELNPDSEDLRMRQTEKLLEYADTNSILAGAMNSMHRDALFSRIYRALNGPVRWTPPRSKEGAAATPYIPSGSTQVFKDVALAVAWGSKEIKRQTEGFLECANGGPLQLLADKGYHDVTTKHESTIDDLPGAQVDHIMLPAPVETVPKGFKVHWMRGMSVHHALLAHVQLA